MLEQRRAAGGSPAMAARDSLCWQEVRPDFRLEAYYSALPSCPRARCSRAHCATMMPTSANGMTRCQPSERPTWTAVATIFGSSSHDGACARAARSSMARARARRRANTQIDEACYGDRHKDRRHHQAGMDAANSPR